MISITKHTIDYEYMTDLKSIVRVVAPIARFQLAGASVTPRLRGVLSGTTKHTIDYEYMTDLKSIVGEAASATRREGVD